jgi:hypothetical protein
MEEERADHLFPKDEIDRRQKICGNARGEEQRAVAAVSPPPTIDRGDTVATKPEQVIFEKKLVIGLLARRCERLVRAKK